MELLDHPQEFLIKPPPLRSTHPILGPDGLFDLGYVLGSDTYMVGH